MATDGKKLRLVEGKRASSRKKKTTAATRRVVFIPRENGEIVCVEPDTLYPLKLLLPVVVTIESDAAGYENLT